MQNATALLNPRPKSNNHINRNNSNSKRRQAAQNLTTAAFADIDLSLDSVASRKEQHLQPTTVSSRSGVTHIDEASALNTQERNGITHTAQEIRQGKSHCHFLDISISHTYLVDTVTATNGRVSASTTVIENGVIANGDALLMQSASDAQTVGDGEADADNDDGRTYCICDTVSYGEMIGCDDDNCERQWVCSFVNFHATLY